MELPLSRCTVRSWRVSDVDVLPKYADNRKIWLNLRDAFPHPYTRADAQFFVRSARDRHPETTFAIEVDRVAVGSIGFQLHTDVERVSAEIGYWLGEPFWGRGITTEALVALTAYAIERHGLTRLYAVPFAWNTPSCRVLEKAGYILEARLRNSAVKDGRLTDQMQYAFIVDAPGHVSASKPRSTPPPRS